METRRQGTVSPGLQQVAKPGLLKATAAADAIELITDAEILLALLLDP